MISILYVVILKTNTTHFKSLPQAPKKNGSGGTLKSRSSSVPAAQRKAFATPKPSSGIGGGGAAGAVDADSFMQAFEDVKKAGV